jgi:hypothetical protein
VQFDCTLAISVLVRFSGAAHCLIVAICSICRHVAKMSLPLNGIHESVQPLHEPACICFKESGTACICVKACCLPFCKLM